MNCSLFNFSSSFSSIIFILLLSSSSLLTLIFKLFSFSIFILEGLIVFLANDGLLLLENKVIEPILSVFFLFKIDFLFSIALTKKLKLLFISLLLLKELLNLFCSILFFLFSLGLSDKCL